LIEEINNYLVEQLAVLVYAGHMEAVESASWQLAQAQAEDEERERILTEAKIAGLATWKTEQAKKQLVQEAGAIAANIDKDRILAEAAAAEEQKRSYEEAQKALRKQTTRNRVSVRRRAKALEEVSEQVKDETRTEDSNEVDVERGVTTTEL